MLPKILHLRLRFRDFLNLNIIGDASLLSQDLKRMPQ